MAKVQTKLDYLQNWRDRLYPYMHQKWDERYGISWIDILCYRWVVRPVKQREPLPEWRGLTEELQEANENTLAAYSIGLLVILVFAIVTILVVKGVIQ